MDRVLVWDFDGTLAHRPGMWRGCLVETLDAHEPGHGIDAERLRPFLRDGFPWHRPQVAHPELSDPDAWWRHGRPRTAWMIGDNPVADVAGAEAAGIPAIVVPSGTPDAARRATDLHAAAGILAVS
jgi:phosphoglycolate phosphatase-like HAD superfamily hydrolase